MVGVFHRGNSRPGRAEIDELGEDSNVILEMGFNGISLNLFERAKRGAFRYKR